MLGQDPSTFADFGLWHGVRAPKAIALLGCARAGMSHNLAASYSDGLSMATVQNDIMQGVWPGLPLPA